MAYLIIIILGIIQGACEFLPISSSGHLVVFYNFFNITENTIMVSIILHVATLFSVVVVYYKDIIKLIKKPFCKTNKLLVVSTIPTVIIVLIFRKLIESSFNGEFIIVSFLITALILFVSEIITKKYTQKPNFNSDKNMGKGYLNSSVYDFDINYVQALIIGVAQGIATIPGISRSGSTISAGLITGVKKEQVANYSFLLSVPIIIASLFYELYKLKDGTLILNFTFTQLLVGFIISFLVGLFCLKVMLNFVKKQKLYIFSIYLVLLCIFLLLNKYVLFLI